MQSYSRLLVNLPVKLTRIRTLYRGAMGGGLYAALLVAVRSHGNQPNGSAADTQWVGGWPKAHGPLCLGKHQCISSPPSSLEYSPPRDGPPNTRGPLEVLVPTFTDFSDFLGSNSSHSRVLFT